MRGGKVAVKENKYDYLYHKLDDALSFIQKLAAWTEGGDIDKERAEDSIKIVMAELLGKKDDTPTKFQKLMEIAEQDLDIYDVEVGCLCQLEDITPSELREYLKRVERLNYAITNVLKGEY